MSEPYISHNALVSPQSVVVEARATYTWMCKKRLIVVKSHLCVKHWRFKGTERFCRTERDDLLSSAMHTVTHPSGINTQSKGHGYIRPKATEATRRCAIQSKPIQCSHIFLWQCKSIIGQVIGIFQSSRPVQDCPLHTEVNRCNPSSAEIWLV